KAGGDVPSGAIECYGGNEDQCQHSSRPTVSGDVDETTSKPSGTDSQGISSCTESAGAWPRDSRLRNYTGVPAGRASGIYCGGERSEVRASGVCHQCAPCE